MTDVIEGRVEGPAGDLTIPSVDVAPESEAVGWRHRHLLDVDGLTVDDLDLVMRTADAMREVLARPIAKVPALRGRNVTLFYEASTRTRASFELAGKVLGADVINVTASAASIEGRVAHRHGSHARAIGAHVLVMRHSSRRAVPRRPRCGAS